MYSFNIICNPPWEGEVEWTHWWLLQVVETAPTAKYSCLAFLNQIMLFIKDWRCSVLITNIYPISHYLASFIYK